MVETKSGAKTRYPRAMPVKCAFGRALNWVGDTAKTVLRTPLRAAHRKRVQSAEAVKAPLALETGLSTSETTLQALTQDYREVVQLTHQKLSSQLQDSAEFLRQHLPFAPHSTSGFLAAKCFPPRLVTSQGQRSLTAEGAQDLVSVGSREMLRIKLYDFAIYLDRKQVRGSQLGRGLSNAARQEVVANGGPELRLTHGIRDSNDIEMCLMVRAARNLPIRLLAKEYERILKRRLRVVGGSSADPALKQMLQHFREESLPDDIKHGGSIRKGTVITFTRGAQGSLSARTDSHDLVSVKSQKLAQAVFDIYLGDQVVCPKARRDAGTSFIRMLDDADFEPPDKQLVCSDKTCRVGRLY